MCKSTTIWRGTSCTLGSYVIEKRYEKRISHLYLTWKTWHSKMVKNSYYPLWHLVSFLDGYHFTLNSSKVELSDSKHNSIISSKIFFSSDCFLILSTNICYLKGYTNKFKIQFSISRKKSSSLQNVFLYCQQIFGNLRQYSKESFCSNNRNVCSLHSADDIQLL